MERPTTAILLCARLGSSRLPRKHLREVNGKPVFQYLLERIQHEFAAELESGAARLVIATSDEPENRQFEQFTEIGVDVYYGILSNIPLRFLRAAESLGAERIVAVDGDDILCSTHAMRAVDNALAQGGSYAAVKDLPFGMNAWGFSTPFLSKSLDGRTEDVLETGWARIFDEQQLVDIDSSFPIQDERLRFTLDYEQDFEFFEAVIKDLGKTVASASDEDIVRLVLDQKLYELNGSLAEEYWRNYRAHVEREKESAGQK